VLTDVRRISAACDLPVLVDIDTGFGGALSIARAVESLARAGAAGVQIEDQIEQKRCGHRPGKQVVPAEEMLERLRAAVTAKQDPAFAIVARTDALAVEGLAAAVERARRYVEAGADMVFPEACTTLEEYRRFVEAVGVPILANLTEFGRTPLLTLDELRGAGVRLALYPLSAFRAMSAAALRVYQTIRQEGTQRSVLPLMQTREELYRHLDYERFEKRLDELLARGRK
jgi:methylisocitrate lyase